MREKERERERERGLSCSEVLVVESLHGDVEAALTGFENQAE